MQSRWKCHGRLISKDELKLLLAFLTHLILWEASKLTYSASEGASTSRLLPRQPMRAVLPIRWMYSAGEAGALYFRKGKRAINRMLIINHTPSPLTWNKRHTPHTAPPQELGCFHPRNHHSAPQLRGFLTCGCDMLANFQIIGQFSPSQCLSLPLTFYFYTETCSLPWKKKKSNLIKSHTKECPGLPTWSRELPALHLGEKPQNKKTDANLESG